MASTDLVVTITVKAPADLVFRAFTTPDGLDQFWTERSETDVRPGGRFALWYEEADEDAEPDATGVYARVSPNRSVVLHFTQEDGSEDDPTPVTVKFGPNERGGTDVELTHANLDDEDEEAIEELYDGWEEILAGLKGVAERWAAKAAKAKADESRRAPPSKRHKRS